MRNMSIVAVMMIPLFLGVNVFAAAEGDGLQEENAALKARIEKLEGQVARLVELMEEKESPAHGEPQTGMYKGLNDEELAQLASMVAEKNNGGKKPVLSNLDIEMYGALRLDAAYDDSAVTDGGGGSYVKWVNSEADNSSDDQYTMTARRTRFGFKIAGPQENGIRTSGKLEMDFSGANDSETSNHIRLRQAYMNMDWLEKDFSILAGQSWDIVSPLNPPTIDAGVLWWSGNIGMRRPQIRLTQNYPLGADKKMTLQGAITRNMGRATSYGAKESGEDDGRPQFQGRIGYASKTSTVGFSGHWGQEEYDTSASGTSKDFDSWSLNLDMTHKFSKSLTLKGEMFYGDNLNQFAGGIGQGVNTTDMREIESRGGWIAACMKPADKWSVNVGYGLDKADSDDLAAASSSKTHNSTTFANCIYALNKNTDIGLEVAHRKTKYKTVADGEDLRLQAMFKYTF